MEKKHNIPDKLFVTQGEEIVRILRRAVQHALLEHKRAGNPIAVWKDGKVVIIPAEEIEIEDDAEELGDDI